MSGRTERHALRAGIEATMARLEKVYGLPAHRDRPAMAVVHRDDIRRSIEALQFALQLLGESEASESPATHRRSRRAA